MADFENATPFGARTMPSSDRDGSDMLLVVVAASFDLPRPGEQAAALRPSDVQDPPPLADEYIGEPGRSSLRIEGQIAYARPATDISILGHACAPDSRPVTAMNVNIRVGNCGVDLRVHGDRVWQRGVTLGATPSYAQPFLKMPLVWERAYGGVAASSTEKRPLYEPRNPIGCGLEANADDAIDKPL